MALAPTALAPAALRSEAEGLAARLPPLLAGARQLAQAVQLGLHGRRRAGAGEEFWQYRPALPGDEARRIDWRRSARQDQPYLRDQEWQAAQTVTIWADRSASMSYRSAPALPAKADHARLLALALTMLLEAGGERIGLAGPGGLPPRAGRAQVMRIAEALIAEAGADYGQPEVVTAPRRARAVFLSDFLGDPAPVEAQVMALAGQGLRGALMQITDPAEEEFPFAGRVLFESMGAALRHETRQAGDLRARYLDRLAARRDGLAALARRAGWDFGLHRTDRPAAVALLWLYQSIGRVG